MSTENRAERWISLINELREEDGDPPVTPSDKTSEGDPLYFCEYLQLIERDIGEEVGIRAGSRELHEWRREGFTFRQIFDWYTEQLPAAT